MARKSKRMALYEAIQQGQAKIAEGLKTGRMRSKAPGSQKSRVPERNVPDQGRPPASREPDIASLKTQELQNSRSGSSKRLIVAAAIVLQMAVLGVGFWLGAIVFKSDSGEKPDQADSVMDSKPAVSNINRRREITENPTKATENITKQTQTQVVDKEPPRLRTSAGVNVIVIQGISEQREGELHPVQEYFKKNGIDTEFIRKSGYSLLVTKAGFDEDPEKSGSEGNKVLTQIKQYGLKYPEVTGDAKFGLKPFQDAYGLKRN